MQDADFILSLRFNKRRHQDTVNSHYTSMPAGGTLSWEYYQLKANLTAQVALQLMFGFIKGVCMHSSVMLTSTLFKKKKSVLNVLQS